MSDNKPRLEVKNLSTCFHTDEGDVPSVADVSFTIRAGETTALVGESGSGKSVTSLTLMRLLPRTARTTVSGSALFVDRAGERIDLLSVPERRMRAIRGNQVAMIFQEPMTSLNPVFTLGEQIAESVRLHKGLDRRAALAHALRMLELVEIPAAAQRLHEYPHQLSGGMRQRVMIALAMACDRTLLIADEPTTALDVTIQAQILHEVQKLCREAGTALIWITHDLSVVASIADQVAVMYAGRLVESGPTSDVLLRPLHPYTRGLLDSLPARNERGRPLRQIDGATPSLLSLPPGCAFSGRCRSSTELCDRSPPPQMIHRSTVRCWSPFTAASNPTQEMA